jgi:hypothetical protein
MSSLSPLLVSKPTAIALTAGAIIVILFAANVTITNAQQQQQQQQQLMNVSQPAAATQNARLFENEQESFRVQVPEGWVIHDVNNTGSTLAAEVTQGYGILAQLCPGEEEGQQQPLNNVSNSSSCTQQQAQEIVHIIRYPNLGARIAIDFDEINNTVSDSILEYVTQKLQEVGYRDINITNSTDTTINVHYINDTQAEELGVQENATVPARLVEMTYGTNSAPSEIRRGYFILTATNATPPNPETITGYSVFYEGVRAAPAAEEETTAAAPSESTAPPPAVRQVFDSFELLPSGEVQLAILQGILEQLNNNQAEEAEEEPEDGGEDNANG